MFEEHEPIYKGGFAKLMRRLEKSQRSYADAAQFIPDIDVDLSLLFSTEVTPPTKLYENAPKGSAEAKWIEIQSEFQGQNLLFLQHAMLVAVSRRNAPPPNTLPLFHRMWREQGHNLASGLSTRWLISASTTFAHCGETSEQRVCGMGLSILFDMVKLYESERRTLGVAGDELAPPNTKNKREKIAFDMVPFSLARGDLDRNMLAHLWQLAESDITIRPLAMRMLRMVMSDQRSVFARLHRIKRSNANPTQTKSNK